MHSPKITIVYLVTMTKLFHIIICTFYAVVFIERLNGQRVKSTKNAMQFLYTIGIESSILYFFWPNCFDLIRCASLPYVLNLSRKAKFWYSETHLSTQTDGVSGYTLSIQNTKLRCCSQTSKRGRSFFRL